MIISYAEKAETPGYAEVTARSREALTVGKHRVTYTDLLTRTHLRLIKQVKEIINMQESEKNRPRCSPRER